MRSLTWLFFHTKGLCISGIAISFASINPNRPLMGIEVFMNFSLYIISTVFYCNIKLYLLIPEDIHICIIRDGR